MSHNSSSNGGVDRGAKYKLMSPAKLPITRSSCITISPGLSPTSFLDSPVFVPNNIKAEPSPTTGSFLRPHMMHGSVNPSSSSSGINCSNDFGGSKSDDFELNPQSGSTSSGLPATGGYLGVADLNPKPSEQAIQPESEGLSRTIASSIVRSSEVAVSAGGQCSSSAVQLRTSTGSMPAEDEVEVPPSQSEQKDTESPLVRDWVAEDGYNWRKYGQKLVKGGEYPRSYYKCTHPNCDVKKLFEQAPDGQMTEIIYKGRHDHPKPLPGRRISAGLMMPIQEQRTEKLSSLNCQEAYNNESSTNNEPSPRATNNTANSEGGVPQSNNDTPDDDDDDPISKRRKMEMAIADISAVVKPIREPRVVVQTISEVDILDDGYRWRKYGQKVVRGNPNPRSYYKCMSLGCPVRKHVERASHDPKAVITTYEGKHNHDVPSAKTSSHDAAAAAAQSTNLASRIMSREGDAVSLNLGVGINSVSDHSVRVLNAWSVPGKARFSNSNIVMIQAPPVGAFPGYVKGAMMMYGSNHIEAHSVGNQSSNPYQQAMERILTHP